MSGAGERIYLGTVVARLRREHQLTQAALAERLDLSPSYLNQIENDQRPVSHRVLERLSACFGMDLRDTVGEAQGTDADLAGLLADPLLAAAGVTRQNLRGVSRGTPAVLEGMLALHRAVHRLQAENRTLAARLAGDGATEPQGALQPHEEARAFFHARRNHVPALDEAAEALWHQAGFPRIITGEAMAALLAERHGVRVREVDTGDLRRYDPARRELTLAAGLPRHRRVFLMAHQLALLGQGETLDALVAEGRFTRPEAAALCRLGLANYFAGALTLPYGPFLTTAEAEGYDLERLQRCFGASFEQVCHRLSTLQRPGQSGVPFFFVRVDIAGNISKRQSATSLHFGRAGGACPLWNVHEAFASPGRILVQMARLPDERR